MIHTPKLVNLYKKIDEELAEKVGIEIALPTLSYIEDGVQEFVELDDNEFNGVIEVNKYDSNWSPVIHDLNIKVEIKLNELNHLFGEHGVTHQENKIGLGALIYSRDSNFQKNIIFDSLANKKGGNISTFEYNFSPNTLRGSVSFEFFAFLNEVNNKHPKQADKKGMLLSNGNFFYLEIVADGEGSNFPIIEIEDEDGPLWQLEKNWIDAKEDVFNESNVHIKLNKSHPIFEQVAKGKQRVQRAYMGDILVQAMTSIIQQVLIVEENKLDDESVIPNSIFSIVQYWVSTFEVDTSTLISISNSLKQYWDRKMIGG